MEAGQGKEWSGEVGMPEEMRGLQASLLSGLQRVGVLE